MKKSPFILVLIFALAGTSIQWQTKKPAVKYGNMAIIPSKNKSFMMGWNKDEAGTEWACFIGKHKVTFTYDLYMDSTMVTQQAYLKLMHRNPSAHKTGNLMLPVEGATWYDAVLYCNARSKQDMLDTVYTYSKVTIKDSAAIDLIGLKYDIHRNGYRLPTNAEYEFTERSGLKGTYFFADTTQNVDEISKAYAWSALNSDKTTQPVAKKKASPWGLYDIIGNLFEWCNDWEGPYPLNDQIDPIGPTDGKTECGTTWVGSEKKVAKGGSYKTDVKGHMRINYHFKWPPSSVSGEVGFRCVATKK